MKLSLSANVNSFCIILRPFLCIFRATGGELFRVIAIEPLPEEKAREVVYQIVDGVQHLHALNIVHLDLKVRGGGIILTSLRSAYAVLLGGSFMCVYASKRRKVV